MSSVPTKQRGRALQGSLTVYVGKKSFIISTIRGKTQKSTMAYYMELKVFKGMEELGET